MQKFKTILIALACAVSLNASAQITFTTDNFKKSVPNVKDVNFYETKDLGIKIKITSAIKKYDKLELLVFYSTDGKAFDRSKHSKKFVYDPHVASFNTLVGSDNSIELYIIKPENGIKGVGDIAKFKKDASNFHKHSYKVILEGYMKNGIEKKWDEYSKSTKTNQLFKYSGIAVESPEFSFAKDESASAAEEGKEKGLAQFQIDYKTNNTNSSFFESYFGLRNYGDPPTGKHRNIGARYQTMKDYWGSPRVSSYSEYNEGVSKRLRKFVQLQEKLIKLQNENLKPLNKSIKSFEDKKENLEQIYKMIMEYTPPVK